MAGTPAAAYTWGMSPPRKPKTLDTDEGARKPSQKVAIDEVLRSLQDLVQNELSIEAPPPAAPRGKAGAKKESLPPPPGPDLPEGFPSLDGMEEEDITLEALPDTEPELKIPAAKAAPVRLPGGQQEELPHLDLPPTGKTLKIVDETPLDLDGLESIEGGADSFSIAFETPTPVPATDDLGPSDIPVLDDAVDLADDFHTPLEASPLPEPLDARRIAIQVTARLNAALRREGKPVLSSEVITRLAQALEEALAKDGSNMENSSPD